MTFAGEFQGGHAETPESSRNAPVVVMAYTGSGVDQLLLLLSRFPDLACTQRTGILPLFHHAMTTWQAVDGTSRGGVSSLAATSLRTLSAALMSAVLARQGGKRWCEFATVPPAAANSFVSLFPQTRFLIAYRQADTAVRAILNSSRWGPEGVELIPYVSAHPANPVAALTSYWAANTAQLLEFEHTHHEKCLRVRMEDLTADTTRARLDIGEFLSLDAGDVSPLLIHDHDQRSQAGGNVLGTGLPLDRIPASLLARVNDLHQSLGYPPVTAATAEQD